MVQQMSEKLNERRPVNMGTGMATADKQQPITEKESAPRDLSSEAKKIPTADGNPPFIKGFADFAKLSGTKRHQTTYPSNPARPANSTATNGHLVYVRRKLDTDAKKPIASGSSNEKEQPVLTSAPSASVSMPSKDPSPPAPSSGHVPTASPVQPEPRKNDQQWRQRFARLQMYLKKCDESSQKEYMQYLRSLPAEIRNRHAYELERRAIQLSIEEAKELRRMKFLNVLSKASPDG